MKQVSIQDLSDAFLERLRPLLPSSFAAVFSVSEDEQTLIQIAGLNTAHEAGHAWPLQHGVMATALATSDPLLIHELPADRYHPALPPALQSLLVVPLHSIERLFGFAVVGHDEAQLYTASDLKLFVALASQFASVIQFLDGQQPALAPEWSREAEILRGIARRAAVIRQLDLLLEGVLKDVAMYMGADVAVAWLPDQAGTMLVPSPASFVNNIDLIPMSYSVEAETIVATVYRIGATFLTEDFHLDDRVIGDPAEQALGTRSVIILPVL
ncbi:MAG: GAF domain-containing protein, partial [Chloroflexi bacterium]|nr:GAF domain-containing protein [Chloroflexota bacterium]